MSQYKVKTPIAFIIFNRPDTTRRVFKKIAEAKPTKLLVIADGPRQNRSEEEKCLLTREIINSVDWDCEVLTNYSNINLGCKKRVSSGLDWVFSTVEEAIVLEDDCLPHLSFFQFCDELLEKYRLDTRIAQIGGVNFQFGKKRSNDSYYFSRYNHVWGWASWRRAWENYDVNMRTWKMVKQGNWLSDIFTDNNTRNYWERIFDDVSDGKIDTWDFQWAFSCFVNRMLTILPNENLVSNIGFGPEATHTVGVSKLADLPVLEMKFPLKSPSFMIRDTVADSFTEKEQFQRLSWFNRYKTKLKSMI